VVENGRETTKRRLPVQTCVLENKALVSALGELDIATVMKEQSTIVIHEPKSEERRSEDTRQKTAHKKHTSFSL
jgi:hypothetical protein